MLYTYLPTYTYIPTYTHVLTNLHTCKHMVDEPRGERNEASHLAYRAGWLAVYLADQASGDTSVRED